MKSRSIKTVVFSVKHNIKRLLCQDRFTGATIRKMNEKAVSLGISSSFFVQPDGAGLKNKSTAYDLLIATSAAYRNGFISSVWSQKEKEIAYQIAVLLRIFQKETKKQYLKDEAERLLIKLEKSLV